MIRVWDLEKEMLVQDIPSGTDDSCVTSMSHDGSGTRIIVAGCGDGSIRLFDYRTKYLAVSTFIEHKDWIVNLHIPKSDSMKLISGSESGELKFWDIKKPQMSTKTLLGFRKSIMTALAVHNYAPILACGSEKQKN